MEICSITFFQILYVPRVFKNEDKPKLEVVNGTGFKFNETKLVTNKVFDAEQTRDKVWLNISLTHGNEVVFASLYISILDVNDVDPYFERDSYIAFVPKNSLAGRFVMNVHGYDGDVSVSGITYWLTNSLGDFDINTENGTITVASDSFREEHYTLKVHISDHGTPPRFNQSSIDIYINQSNLNTPKFEKEIYSVHLNITDTPTLANKPVVTVRATDPDAGDAGHITYVLKNDGDHSFKMNPSSGEITINGSSRNYKKSYILIVEAVDSGIDPKSSTVPVLVTITQPPRFSEHMPKIFVHLPFESGVTIIQLTTTDAEPSNLTFSLLNHTNIFRIENTGTIKSKQKLENVTNYTIWAMVIDEYGLTDTTNVTFFLIRGGNFPIFNPPYFVGTIRENMTGPVNGCDVNTTQELSGTVVTYSMSGRSNSMFQIDNRTVSFYFSFTCVMETNELVLQKVF